jgi:hypothetical protein
VRKEVAIAIVSVSYMTLSLCLHPCLGH